MCVLFALDCVARRWITSAEISVLWTEIVWLVVVGCLTPLQLECGLI